MNFNNKKVAILGWGMNGLDAYQYLVKLGADLTIYDRKEKSDLDLSKIDKQNIRLVVGKNYLKDGLCNYDFIIRSPGVYRYLPEIKRAEKEGVKITSVIKLFFDLCPAKIIGVTGTKGKGTTSTLIYQILKNDRKNVYLAGNIGEPVLELLPKLSNKSWIVLELSSFQLIDLEKSPHIAVVLNITEDHLDWHKDKREYIKSKIQIVKYQNNKDYAVLNYDYALSRNFSKYTKAKAKYFSTKQKVNGAYVYNGNIVLKTNNSEKSLGKVTDLLLRGKHNWENVCASVCASFIAGCRIASIKKTIYEFKGLEHRLELVADIKCVKFYNDSFSTNPQTTIAAIKSFTEPTTLILGGSDKGLNYNDMGKEITDYENVVNIILIGDISNIIEKSLKKAKYPGNVIRLGRPGMKEIVKKGLLYTPKGGVVLLSPATASFDMFKDYKDRGNQFKNEVLLYEKRFVNTI